MRVTMIGAGYVGLVSGACFADFGAAGAKIRAFDPAGRNEAEKLLRNVTFCSSPYEALHGGDTVAIITEWDEFRALDLERVKSLLSAPIMADLRNIYDPGHMQANGIQYTFIGRPESEDAPTMRQGD